MTQRVAVVPMETHVTYGKRSLKYFPGAGDNDPADNVASLFDPNDPNRTDWDWVHYGLSPWALAAVDGPDTVMTALGAKADVEMLPADLSGGVPNVATRDRVRGVLETAGLPGNWVQTGTVWRTIVRVTYGVIVFSKRVDAIRQRTQPGAPALGSQMAANMGVQWQNIPQATRDAVTQAAAELGVDTTGVLPTTTVREVLRLFGVQWANAPVRFNFNNLRTAWDV